MDIQRIAEAVKIAIKDSLREEISQMISEKVEPLQAKVDELQSENKQLRAHLDELEQYGRRPIVRISGISETPTEDTDQNIGGNC